MERPLNALRSARLPLFLFFLLSFLNVGGPAASAVASSTSKLEHRHLQVFSFNVSGPPPRKAASCSALCAALGTAKPSPRFHSCGFNWRNVTTVYRRPYPTDCGGFSFFSSRTEALSYWKALPASQAFRRAIRAVSGQAWSGVPMPPGTEAATTAHGASTGALPWTHLIQYSLRPSAVPRAAQVLAQFRRLSKESIPMVPGYKGWNILGYATRPQGVTLGPWFSLAGFVPFPDLRMLESYLNYTAFHSKTHSGAANATAAGAHVMYKAGLVTVSSWTARDDYSQLGNPPPYPIP